MPIWRGEVELVRLPEAEGRIAAEGALPYPPGVLCVVPGEILGRFCPALFQRPGGRGLTCCRALRLNCRVFISKNTTAVSRSGGYVIKPRDAQRSLLQEEKL
ncbi:Ornithine decarboxylase, inducible [Salmonella enterica subsp. arizonae]|uniref:Ornithine decarboxylase, inducible n=1 Tax=Salmonella enterica subsp. arizonae TaxID=59203 RepID=A0A379TDS5_SALER|nr:Ornithine decarboxylase, inducible [Salmonella enterica subsp. arizonae]